VEQGILKAKQRIHADKNSQIQPENSVTALQNQTLIEL